ncbi:MAG: hypothetical protein KA116_05675 [Proteobacteria bacterium]|nr:hypothetical protein [Pseudomonadota bacterium]
MKNLWILLALSFSFMSSAKTTLRVDAPQLNDVEASKGILLKALIEDAVRSHSSYILSQDSKSEASLTSSLHKLDNNYLFIMALNTKDNSRSERVKLSSLDELDTAVSRLSDSVLEGKTLAETATQGEILNRDSRSRERVKSIRGFELGLGTGFPLTQPLGDKEAMWALGFGFAWDVDEAFLETRWDALSHFGDNNPGSYNTFTLGGNYFWHDTSRYGVFSGANFGFANSSNSKIQSKSGFHIGLDTGVLLFRHADVNLEFRARYMIMVSQIKGAYPQLFSMILGLHL